MRKADVRFYFDADILGLAHIICAQRADSTYPGDPGAIIKGRERSPCVIETPRAKDGIWIPTVAEQGWVAITRDSDIQTHVSLMQAVKDRNLRMVTLTGPDCRYPWGQLEITMTQWRKIEAVCDRVGPALFSATRTSFTEIDIDKRLAEIRAGRAAAAQQRATKRAGKASQSPLF